MAAQDKNKLVNDLIEIGKQRGELTTKQINDLLEEFDFDIEQVDKLYEKIEGSNIKIVEDMELDIDTDLESLPLEELAEGEEGVDGVNVDDPVKVYLKEIGRVPLLSAEEELTLSEQMAEGDSAAAKQLCRKASALLTERNRICKLNKA